MCKIIESYLLLKECECMDMNKLEKTARQQIGT